MGWFDPGHVYLLFATWFAADLAFTTNIDRKVRPYQKVAVSVFWALLWPLLLILILTALWAKKGMKP